MSRELVADYIARLVPYVPGKPMEELERELGITDSIKVASNENPLGPSPKALRAIRAALKTLNRYPDGNATVLKEKLAGKLKVKPEMIVMGNGSNEVLELAAATFMRPGDHAVISEHAFVVYDLAVDSRGLSKTVVPPGKNYGHDLAAMARAVTDKTRMLFIANPNNPTGTMATRAEMDALLKSLPEPVIVVLDEAYFEYVEDPAYPDGVELVKSGARLIATRTFSKIYGLAGCRIGYGVMPAEFADYMNRVRQPFNTNSLAQAAAYAALDDDAFVRRSRATNRKGLKYLYREFKRLKLEFIPSVANFVLFKSSMEARVLYERLLHQGVIVRPMGGYKLPQWLRVTVGTPAENRRFISALEGLL
ncbi:MAG: histidinol-phosphate transaminase [Deltaproteobacteria bacterium RBG_13_61_14]|nr:MAG: histidinol-phosphate transaminase [Deltaproteobacteria bacterium RBG_13_61_14]